MKPYISRELFIETIEAIKKQRDHDRKCADALKTIYPDAFNGNLLYDNSALLDQLVKLLQVAFDDTGTWIEYFIYELDFGAESGRLNAYRKDGSIIDLSTPGALYDFLIENVKEKEQ